MKQTVPSEILVKIKSFIGKLERKYQEQMLYVLKKTNNNSIHLRTDGTLLTLIYDPSLNEEPYLMKEASEEFGFEYEPVDQYRYRKKFTEMLTKHGWNMECQGIGVIHIYR